MYGEMKYKATSMISICLGTREEQACLNTISMLQCCPNQRVFYCIQCYHKGTMDTKISVGFLLRHRLC
jgi:hypothetical protein